MLNLLSQPWPWYTSGAAIAGIMVLLLYFGKSFGFSSNLRTICSMAGAGKHVKFFDFNWQAQKWNLLFLVGSVLGGLISATVLKSDIPLQLSTATIKDLAAIGIHFDGQLNPSQLFSIQSVTLKNILLLLGGGLLVGFGTRYAGGCTSGHAISGLSNLQLPSLIAVIGFFAGGLIMTHFLLPLLLAI
ncbi:YeeE/YedE family protein [Inquilinus sp. KBS0705]|nr:YeeE/YedE family protein [Inquilinus sp. KBS0705]